jgi:hypothetical protein
MPRKVDDLDPQATENQSQSTEPVREWEALTKDQLLVNRRSARSIRSIPTCAMASTAWAGRRTIRMASRSFSVRLST